jgi:protocatechuate 3,4-dioxygenase beta subunit
MRYLAPAILWCLSAFGQAPNAPQGAPSSTKPDAKCSIEGAVVNSITGEPVRKARVQLTPLGTSQPIPYATTTDASGHYLINEVDAGRYALEAYREGYSNPSFKSNRTFTLEPGQELKHIALKLSPVGLVSGRVFDEDGDPVSNATVDCIGFRYLDGVRRLDTRGRATTNDAGDFRLSISTAGKCAIRATPPSKGGYPVHERPIGQAHGNAVAAEQEYVSTYYPQTAKPGTASAIDVTPGAQISGINITLLRGATVQVKGQIKSQAAANPAHMSVQLAGWDSENMYTVVDSKRGFQFTGLLPGSYSLLAVGDNGYRARVPIDVSDQNIEGLEVILQPPATIQGRVVFEGKSELKSRLPVLTITETTGMDARSAQVQDDLTFKFDAVTPGSYRLRVEGVSNTYVKRIRVGEQESPEAPFDVIPGAGELTAFLSPNAGVIEGSVKNAKDEPAPSVLVTLIPEASRRTRLHKIAITDQNGHFKIEGIIPGEYKIYAWEQIEEGSYEDPDFMKAHESEGEKVSIKERAHETMQLKVIPAETTGKEKPDR